ncbi:hypothetical protein CQW39_21650 [Streptomyces griseofuscus]|uniref:DUF4158 domain-containing protein n=1 Tax=Streptomyces griseofuscus TaxID=146922 RepID=A0A3R8RPR8_9ACTN|nr:hypothetical protein CQW39_21650 [Streptomyces griseofuscus]RRQ88682.1 hypothetical protein CQW44_05930 [Streptomyces griseofuscus]
MRWRPGSPEDAGETPGPAVSYVAQQVKVPEEEWAVYDWAGRAIKRHRMEIRGAFGFRECTEEDQVQLADPSAVRPDRQVHHRPAPGQRRGRASSATLHPRLAQAPHLPGDRGTRAGGADGTHLRLPAAPGHPERGEVAEAAHRRRPACLVPAVRSVPGLAGGRLDRGCGPCATRPRWWAPRLRTGTGRRRRRCGSGCCGSRRGGRLPSR